MASKIIQVSIDAGSTYFKLPGSTGSFSIDGESIEDTIFGQEYQSNDVGLLSWSVSGNAFFKGFPGYNAQILKPGTTTSMTADAMTVVSGKTFSIDDAAKEIWDRSLSLVILDDATPVVDADIESIDFLLGQVTFASTYTVVGAITVTGNYFPTISIGKSQSYTLTMTKNAIDDSDFATVQGNNGYRTFTNGLRTVQLELGGVFDATEDLAGDLAARTELIFEIDAAGDGSSIARGFFKETATGQSGDVGALEESSLTAMLVVPDQTPDVTLPFTWRHTSTTLSQGVQDALDAWLNNTALLVQYLPQGTAGQSPLDGKEGTAIVTDISMSGGLTDMNTFNVDLQGSGEVTTI